MTRRFYPGVLEQHPKGTYGAWFPDFPDCVAAGPSQEEAIRKAEYIVAQAVDRLAEQDLALPAPTAIDNVVLPKSAKFVAFFVVGVEPPDPSERVNIYLPKSLIARADKRAAELGMSRSSFFGFAVISLIGWSVGIATPMAALPRSKAEKVDVPVTSKPGKRRVR